MNETERMVMGVGTYPEDGYKDFEVFNVRKGETDEEAIARAKSAYSDNDEFYIKEELELDPCPMCNRRFYVATEQLRILTHYEIPQQYFVSFTYNSMTRENALRGVKCGCRAYKAIGFEKEEDAISYHNACMHILKKFQQHGSCNSSMWGPHIVIQEEENKDDQQP